MSFSGLRVALVGPLPPPAGGMANQTRQLAELLRQEGASVELVQVNAPYRPAWIGRVQGLRAVARLLPKGTHQYQDFIKPAELASWLRNAGLQLEDVSGLAYEPWRNGARIISRTDVNYLASATKPA